MSPQARLPQQSTEGLGRTADLEPEFVAAMRNAMNLSIAPATLAPKVGGLAPSFRLNSTAGDEVALVELLTRGPVVINFYRGDWCPYCNLELQRLTANRHEMGMLGATLVAISPDYGGTIKSEGNEHNPLTKLLDPDSKVGEAYGVRFDLAFSLRDLYTRYGASLPSADDSRSMRMPLPATYVIGQDSRIALSFIDVDYRHQLRPETVLNALRSLKEQRSR